MRLNNRVLSEFVGIPLHGVVDFARFHRIQRGDFAIQKRALALDAYEFILKPAPM